MKISFIHKAIVCCLAGFIFFFGLQGDLNHHIPDWLSKCILVLCVGFVTISILYIPVWQIRERKGIANSSRILAFWQGIIIYVEALVFFKFGLLKLFGLHMTSSLILGDLPGDAISGYHLVDYFFGRAPLFKLIIGWLQLSGSATLLFRRTRLLGTFILLPIIVNIVCIDVLYNIGHVTLIATTLLLGLVYLLFQEREKLLRFFFYTESAMPAFHFKSLVLKNLGRLSALGIPCLVLVPAIKPVSNATILGKYSVTSLKVNSKQIPMDMNSDSLLTAVYLDQNETCMLRYNNYHHLKIGGVLYDANSGTLKVRWRYPVRENDTVVFRFSGQGDQKVLSGKINGDNITATLIKTDLPDEVIK